MAEEALNGAVVWWGGEVWRGAAARVGAVSCSLVRRRPEWSAAAEELMGTAARGTGLYYIDDFFFYQTITIRPDIFLFLFLPDHHHQTRYFCI